MVGLCSVGGCDKAGRLRRGWCNAHYLRWYIHGDVGEAVIRERRGPQLGALCEVGGCSRPASSRGMCKKHYGRFLVHGSPDGRAELNLRPRYDAAHMRVKAARGTAGAYQCSCGQPATGWSYNHECDEELVEEIMDARDGKVRPMAYCPHSEHYEALCHSCHTSKDRRVALSRKG